MQTFRNPTAVEQASPVILMIVSPPFYLSGPSLEQRGKGSRRLAASRRLGEPMAAVSNLAIHVADGGGGRINSKLQGDLYMFVTSEGWLTVGSVRCSGEPCELVPAQFGRERQ